MKDKIEVIRRNKFLILILIFSVLLLFTNLGNRTLFGDEAYTVLVAKTVVENGYPSSYYNDFQINSKETANFNVFGKSIYTWNTWGQFYLTAGSYALFGLNEFALRFPYALIGFFTIILLYFFVEKLTTNRKIAAISALLLATSIPFILHMRQARWYSLVTFFVLATIYAYWLFIKERKISWLILSSILLFHSNILIFFVLMLVLLLHLFIFAFHKSLIRKGIFSAAIIALFTLPWFFITGQASKFSGMTFSITKVIFHFILNWYYIFVLVFPAIFLLIFLLKKQRRELLQQNYFLILFVVFAFILILSLKSDVPPAIRYLICLAPLFSILLAYIIFNVYNKNKAIAIIIILLLVLTNLIHIFPFALFKDTASNIDIGNISEYEREKFIKNSLRVRSHLTEYLYEITHDYYSSEELIIENMLKYGSSTDTFTTSHFEIIIITYTDMKYIPVSEIVEHPDWIVKRSFRIGKEEVDSFFAVVNTTIDLSEYELIKLDNFDERWADSPDPISHRYRTNSSGEILVYHLRE